MFKCAASPSSFCGKQNRSEILHLSKFLHSKRKRSTRLTNADAKKLYAAVNRRRSSCCFDVKPARIDQHKTKFCQLEKASNFFQTANRRVLRKFRKKEAEENAFDFKVAKFLDRARASFSWSETRNCALTLYFHSNLAPLYANLCPRRSAAT